MQNINKINLRQAAKAYTNQTPRIIRQGFITNAFNELIKNPKKTIEAISNLFDNSTQPQQTELQKHLQNSDSDMSLYTYGHNAIYKTHHTSALARFFERQDIINKHLSYLIIETADIEKNDAYQRYRESLLQQGFELKIGRFIPKDTNSYPATNLIITELKPR